LLHFSILREARMLGTIIAMNPLAIFKSSETHDECPAIILD